MKSMTGKYYNVIMNHKNYKTDYEIIVQGEDNEYQDVIRNFYSLYGNVIMSSCNTYD